MTDQTETAPIRKSSLPTTPPPEFVFSTVLGARPDGHPGCMLLPGDMGPVVVRRRVTYGDWEPVRPDRWADEPETDAAPAVPVGQAPDTDRAATDADRLHDKILTLEAERAELRGLLRKENQRANAAIDREETAEQAAEEHRLALSEALGLGTGAPWDAIHERARALRSADESAQEGWEQAAMQRSRATAWREGAEQAESEVERLRIDRAAVLREAIDVAREEGHRLEQAAGIESARGARSVAYLLRKLLVKAQPAVVSAVPGQTDNETPSGCNCSHPADEHSVYGCADGCACEWMPRRPPMDPVHILGIDVDDDHSCAASGCSGEPAVEQPAAGAQQTETCTNCQGSGLDPRYNGEFACPDCAAAAGVQRSDAAS